MTDPVFWIAVAVVSIGVALAIATPLLRAGQRLGGGRRASYDIAVYRDQLAEVERDREAGRMSEAEAAAARSEIERRMLRAVDARAEAGMTEATGDLAGARKSAGAAFPIAVGLVVAVAAVAVYLNIGQPGLRDAPLAARADVAAARAAAAQGGGGVGGADGRAMIAQLRSRLDANPKDLQGWLMLARTHRALGQHPEAVRAYEKAIGVAGDDAPAQMISDYGEALVFEAFGTVSPRAVEVFRQALDRDPGDVKSRFYIAASRAQSGDYRGAVALWRGLTADAPPNAPWIEAVRERIADAAMRGNFMPIEVEPERPGGAPAARPAPPPAAPGASGVGGAIAGDARPTQQDVAAAQDMAPQDRMAFINSMVARLAEKMEANPDDIDGWIRLGRAYKVLGQEEKAAQALGEAKTRLEGLLAEAPAGSLTRPAVEQTLGEVKELMAQ